MVLREAVAGEGRGIGAELPLDAERDRRVFLGSITSETQQSFVAVDDDGKVIGNLGIELQGYGVAELGMMVEVAWRGRGVGSALLTAGLEWARAVGAHKVALQHWPTNQRAAALYEKFGFVEEGRLRRHYRRRSGQVWDAVVRGLLLNEDAPGGPEPAPVPEPFATGHLDVGDGHVLFYEQVGTPEGTPVVYLHGGPGSGCTPGTRRYFDLDRHRAVLFDQRAAGRSTPHASEEGVPWASIDMDHHVADIEQLREHLDIERWIVFGVSWGSVLGATYAERHPERVLAVVLGAASTGTADDIDWLTVHAGRFFPAEWRAFRDHVPAQLRGVRLVDAYNELLMDPDAAVREAAAVAWCRWEDAHVATTPRARPNPRFDDARFRLGFARQVTHCWRHNSWLAPDEIVRNAERLAGISGWLIHGRLDLSGPLDAPWRLHQAWPGSELIVVDHEGHGGETMVAHWSRVLADLA